MKTKALLCAVATSISVIASGAIAGTVGQGTYEIEDADQRDPVHQHGLWLASFFGGPGGGSYDANQWSIQEGTATVGADSGGIAGSADSLEFNFKVTNNWANNQYGGDYTFSFQSVEMAETTTPQSGPVCEANACNHIGNDKVDYFWPLQGNFLGTLVGEGSLAGWMVDLFIKPQNGNKPPQLGLGGSWFAHNAVVGSELDGFATWLKWEAYKVQNGPVLLTNCLTASNVCGPHINKKGHGDINWVVGAQVPLPAAGWLLIGGLGGLVAMKRRSKSKS